MEISINKSEPVNIKQEANSFAEISLSAYLKDEPIAFRFVRSGWSRPQTFHVLIEFGDYSDTTYKVLMTGEQIKEEYGIDMPSADEMTLTKIDKDNPNNMDMGKAIRSLVLKCKQKVEI